MYYVSVIAAVRGVNSATSVTARAKTVTGEELFSVTAPASRSFTIDWTPVGGSNETTYWAPLLVPLYPGTAVVEFENVDAIFPSANPNTASLSVANQYLAYGVDSAFKISIGRNVDYDPIAQILNSGVILHIDEVPDALVSGDATTVPPSPIEMVFPDVRTRRRADKVVDAETYTSQFLRKYTVSGVKMVECDIRAMSPMFSDYAMCHLFNSHYGLDDVLGTVFASPLALSLPGVMACPMNGANDVRTTYSTDPFGAASHRFLNGHFLNVPDGVHISTVTANDVSSSTQTQPYILGATVFIRNDKTIENSLKADWAVIYFR